jgi:hypothetical protein
MTAAAGTIPALPQYASGGLALAGTEAVEIVSTTSATTAASYHLLITDLVGKVPGVLGDVSPVSTDMIAVYRPSTGLPYSVQVGNLNQPAGNLPVSGATGTFLFKNSGTDYDASWRPLSSAIASGAAITITGSTSLVIAVTTGGISSAQLGAFAVNSSKIATNAVGSLQIATFGVVATSIATNVITQVQLATFAVVATSIATSAVQYGNIQNVAALSLLGVTGSAIATVAEITAISGGQVMAANAGGTAIIWQSLSVPLDASIGSTRGMIAYRNDTSWVALAAGTAGYHLQTLSTSANPQWAGSKTLLNTLTAAQVASCTDTTSFTSRYSLYEIEFENVCPVATAVVTSFFGMLISTTGTSWVAANYISSLGILGANHFYTTAVGLSGNLASTSIGTGTTTGLSGTLTLRNPAGTAARKAISGLVQYAGTGTLGTANIGVGLPLAYWDATNAITGLAFVMSTGNIATGTIRIYGIN